MAISFTAWAAGMAGALLYLMLAWPLAKLLSHTRLMLVSFQAKLLIALVIGIVAAPIAENHAPYLRDKALIMISKSEHATKAYNTVARMLR
ncbi:MAG: hypothetical protein CMK07_10670 [Ponticaulis sp.]|nr:hypothetical protein [Ponticaulis sp.]